MYNHKAIEKKWQQIWIKNKTYQAKKDLTLPKYYALDMFPYPSGAGLHVGHVTGYTGTDILARYMRMKGYNVLHPMGWDSFGLPAEQYAIKTGTHPAVTTKKNIETYRRQLQALGFSYDWDRELATSDPSYYKWTQWIFTLLYEKGLAYEAVVHVNFCPALGTVLANEEVEEGKSKEGGYPVEKRPLRQWVLKITAYAERLLEDLEDLDWPDHLKKLQANWIGKSEGAEIVFDTENEEKILIFTTRPDTIFGVTYLVLAPEHPLTHRIAKKEAKVASYQKEALSKSDIERSESKEKTGVFTGSFALHPLTGQKVPIWVADYVLGDYGSGAVMAVPGNDERDFEFAVRYHLPIIPTYDPIYEEEIREEVLQKKCPYTKDGKLINSDFLNGLSMEEGKKRVVEALERGKKGKKAIHYKLRDWLFSRQRYWGEPFPIIHFENGEKRCLGIDELPLIPPPLEDYKPSETGESPLAKIREWVEVVDPLTKRKGLRETNTMPQWAGSCWYYLRFIDPENAKEAWSQELEKYWMPVDLYVGGTEHATLHLLYARFWHKVLFDLGLVHTNEPFRVYRNQGLVTARSYKKKGGGYLAEEDVEQKGDAYYELGGDEPLISQVEKMSKSKLNGVTPDAMIDEFGADALRLYEMFMGPFDKEKVWNTDAVSGCYRFLNRFYEMAFSDKVVDDEDEEGMKLAYRLAHFVMKGIETMQFNTAIAKMMEFLNAFIPLPRYPKKGVQIAAQMLFPFAPHIGEEIWEKLGSPQPILEAPLPTVLERYLEDDTCTVVVQVNGKVRAKLLVGKDEKEDIVKEKALLEENVKKHLTGKILKVIFVPNKLLNFVLA